MRRDALSITCACLTVSCLALTLAGPGAARLYGATPTGPTLHRADLPDTIRLVRRGLPADRYTLTSNLHLVSTLRFNKEGKFEDTKTDITETRTEKDRVRSSEPDGSLKIEERTDQGSTTTLKNGERDVVTLKPEAWLVTYSPAGQRLSRVPAPLKQEPSENKPDAPATAGGASDQQDAPMAPPVNNDMVTSEPPFPDQDLHVGDTWTGTLPMLPREILANHIVSYTAKLAAIEMHQKVPCARVEYTFTASSTQLPLMIVQQVANESTATGSVKVTGKATRYYSLDRGAVLDGEGQLTITLKFDVAEPLAESDQDQHRTVTGTIRTVTSSTATAFPPYKAELISAPASGK